MRRLCGPRAAGRPRLESESESELEPRQARVGGWGAGAMGPGPSSSLSSPKRSAWLRARFCSLGAPREAPSSSERAFRSASFPDGAFPPFLFGGWRAPPLVGLGRGPGRPGRPFPELATGVAGDGFFLVPSGHSAPCRGLLPCGPLLSTHGFSAGLPRSPSLPPSFLRAPSALFLLLGLPSLVPLGSCALVGQLGVARGAG